MGAPCPARIAAVTALTVLAVNGNPTLAIVGALTALAVAMRVDGPATLASLSLTGADAGVAYASSNSG